MNKFIKTSPINKVALTAMNIPIIPNRFPLRAEVGEDKPFNANIKNTDKVLGLNVASDWEGMVKLMKEYNDLDANANAADAIVADAATANDDANVKSISDAIKSIKNYENINTFSKAILAFAMLLGRLEIFTLLVILTPMFWAK